jgi:hypothetical protein
MAKVLHLFRAPKKRAPMEELATAHVVENVGLEGCAHARSNGKSFPFNQALRPFAPFETQGKQDGNLLEPKSTVKSDCARPGG